MTPMNPAPHEKLFHRFPFVMFDRCDRIEEGASAATRLLSIDDALLEGGVGGTFTQALLVEAMAQTAALFAESSGRSRSGMLVGLKRVSFGAMPRAGDRLEVRAALVQKFGDLLRVQGSVHREGEVIAEGEILISLAGGLET
jgi:3-hydroxymyristoyl/3-hydroxydecanoyl-(acyl carrier protein) dehydratase